MSSPPSINYDRLRLPSPASDCIFPSPRSLSRYVKLSAGESGVDDDRTDVEVTSGIASAANDVDYKGIQEHVDDDDDDNDDGDEEDGDDDEERYQVMSFLLNDPILTSSQMSSSSSFSTTLPGYDEHRKELKLFLLPSDVRGNRVRDFAEVFGRLCVLCYLRERDVDGPLSDAGRHSFIVKCPDPAPELDNFAKRWWSFKARVNKALDGNTYCTSCGLPHVHLPTSHRLKAHNTTCNYRGFVYVLILWVRLVGDRWSKAVDYFNDTTSRRFAPLLPEMEIDDFVVWCQTAESADAFYNGLELVIWALERYNLWHPRQPSHTD